MQLVSQSMIKVVKCEQSLFCSKDSGDEYKRHSHELHVVRAACISCLLICAFVSMDLRGKERFLAVLELTLSLLLVLLDEAEFVFFGVTLGVPFDFLLVTGVVRSGSFFCLLISLCSSSSSSLLSSEKLSSSDSFGTKL